MSDINPNPEEVIAAELATVRAEILQGTNLGAWWNWTLDQFTAWCDLNLMSDAAIDALTLSAALKANLKANNTFTRNAGKLLIVTREIVKWLVRKL